MEFLSEAQRGAVLAKVLYYAEKKFVAPKQPVPEINKLRAAHEAEILRSTSPEEFEHGIREDVIDGLLGGGPESVGPVLACIVETVSENDRRLLDELDRLIREKKRELQRKR